MKICERGLNFIQIIDAHGEVRVCGWNRGNIIGSLLEDDLHTIYHGKAAERVRKPMIDGTYTDCQVDHCPFLANGTLDEHCIELDEIPEYPSELYLAYEGNCNYHCTCCTSYTHMIETAERDWSDSYDKIEESLKDVLPHIKKISANGRGELFCSPRILNILANWKPLAPTEEVSVMLETNGSLFNEKNWAKISNLGQYHLSVDLTIMSFDEDTYQYLSGTKLPLQNLINNLYFVKKLREEGVIDYLELATVMQERNFREMPEFARRCIEEFGADNVRIRPIMPGGPLDPRVQWFMDVRNPYHPYYEEYKKVMEHEIFKNPKVLLWSGNLDSSRGAYPAERELKYAQQIQDMTNEDDFCEKIVEYLENTNAKDIWLYGVTPVTKAMVRRMESDGIVNLSGVLDKYSRAKCLANIPICNPMDMSLAELDKSIIVVTVFGREKEIEKDLRNMGYNGMVITTDELLQIIGCCNCCGC